MVRQLIECEKVSADVWRSQVRILDGDNEEYITVKPTKLYVYKEAEQTLIVVDLKYSSWDFMKDQCSANSWRNVDSYVLKRIKLSRKQAVEFVERTVFMEVL